jgi:hypothetical protein
MGFIYEKINRAAGACLGKINLKLSKYQTSKRSGGIVMMDTIKLLPAIAFQ